MDKFRCQFIISRNDIFPDGFEKIALNQKYILAYHKDLKVSRNEDSNIFLLGYSWQTKPELDNPEVCIARKKANNMTKNEIWDMEKTWCGEYVLIVGNEIYTDATAMKCVYYDGDVIASDISLIDYNLQRKSSICNTVLCKGIPFMPSPLVTDSVKRLLPSQSINYINKKISFRPLLIDCFDKLQVNQLKKMFIETYTHSLNRMTGVLKGDIWLSLTGGKDSRTTLALMKHSGIDFKCFTIERAGFLMHGLEDCILPPILAARVNIPHIYLGLSYEHYNDFKYKEYISKTYGLIQGNSAVDYANGISDRLRSISNGQVIWIRSSIWEFYCSYFMNIFFDSKEMNSDTFIRYNMDKGNIQNKKIETSLREYFEWVDDNPQEGISKINRFYWEQGCGAWMAPTEQATEMEDNIISIQPLNSRYLLSFLAALPSDYQFDRNFQIEVTNELCPQFNNLEYKLPQELYSIPYYFPYHLFPYNASIAVYGAGKIGRICVNKIKRDKLIKIKTLIDKNADSIGSIDGIPVIKPEDFKMDKEIDSIFLAVADCKIAWDIKKTLIELGIEEERVKYIIPLPFCKDKCK